MSDESLFREVEEDVRRERLEQLWKRYGNLAVAASAGVILAVAGMKGWQYWQRQQAEAAGESFYQAVELVGAGKQADSTKQFETLQNSGHSGFAKMARLRVAGDLAAAGKRNEAVAAYDAITADSSYDQALRDVARVRAAYLLADTASSADLKSRLAGLDVDGSLWRNAAREILAVAAYREADYLTADRLLNELIADTDAPASARQRAQIVVAMLQPLLQSKATAQ